EEHPDTRRRRCLEWWEEHGRSSDDRHRYRRGRLCSVQWLATVLLDQTMTTTERAWALDELSLAVEERMPDSRDWLARVHSAIRAASRTAGRLDASGWLAAS